MFSLKNIKQLFCKHVYKEVVLEQGIKRKYYHTNYDTEVYYDDIVECTCYKCKNKKLFIKKDLFKL